jgi:hypothetical protein
MHSHVQTQTALHTTHTPDTTRTHASREAPTHTRTRGRAHTLSRSQACTPTRICSDLPKVLGEAPLGVHTPLLILFVHLPFLHIWSTPLPRSPHVLTDCSVIWDGTPGQIPGQPEMPVGILGRISGTFWRDLAAASRLGQN